MFGWVAAQALTADVVALAVTWRPDLVVRDNSEFGGWVAAEELGRPDVLDAGDG